MEFLVTTKNCILHLLVSWCLIYDQKSSVSLLSLPPSFHPPTSAAEAAAIVTLADVPGLFIETSVIVEDLVKKTKSLDEPPGSL